MESLILPAAAAVGAYLLYQELKTDSPKDYPADSKAADSTPADATAANPTVAPPISTVPVQPAIDPSLTACRTKGIFYSSGLGQLVSTYKVAPYDDNATPITIGAGSYWFRQGATGCGDN